MQSETERDSKYRHLERKSIKELITDINTEDKTVAYAVERSLDAIEKLIAAVVSSMESGGSLFYIGAGTSGRLGILDASECPPTFGVSADVVIGIIAGGDKAIRKAVEGAEDDVHQGMLDLDQFLITERDFLLGIAASGHTPYVMGALRDAAKRGIKTGCLTCNPHSPMLPLTDFPVCIDTGPEFVTGSTRMKAGTAQKMVLNMISTTAMIRMGRVADNKMVDMQLSNEKLVQRGTRMIMAETDLDESSARALLLQEGSVRKALASLKGN
jgi:N-acetylmuramic acid 6-phosphate etherase